MKEKEFEDITTKIQKLIDLYQKRIKWNQIKGISDLDITLPQYFALTTIYTLKYCNMKELAENLEVSYPTVTGIVDRLVRNGYAKRSNSTEDRRVIHVELSEKGLKTVKKINKIKYEYLQKALRNLSDEELVQGVESFTVFSKALLDEAGK